MKTLGSITPQTAREILGDCHIPLGSDFHALPTNTVLGLIDYADNYKYRKPHHANGSRARYFHDALQRRATTLQHCAIGANERSAQTMKFRLEINMDNEAFNSTITAFELARILRKTATEIENYGRAPTESASLFDINGNYVGHYKAT